MNNQELSPMPETVVNPRTPMNNEPSGYRQPRFNKSFIIGLSLSFVFFLIGWIFGQFASLGLAAERSVFMSLFIYSFDFVILNTITLAVTLFFKHSKFFRRGIILGYCFILLYIPFAVQVTNIGFEVQETRDTWKAVEAGGDVALCQEIKDETKKSECLKYAAIANNDLSLCEAIRKNGPNEVYPFSTLIKIDCLTQLAIKRGDAEICNRMSPPDDCLYLVATNIDDTGICSLIKDLKRRELCIKYATPN